VLANFVPLGRKGLINNQLTQKNWMQKNENDIGGEMVAPASGEYFDNFEPATAAPSRLSRSRKFVR
jgi:hypothetical protein